MKGFIVYPTYRIIDNKAYVYLFGRLENGETFLTINHEKAFFYIKKDDEKKAKQIIVTNDKEEKIDFDTQATEFSNFKDEPVVKVTTNIPKNVPHIRKKFEKQEIRCYEADVRFAQRFLINNKLQGTINIEGTPKKEENTTAQNIFSEAKITPTPLSSFEPKLKILSFDIETNRGAKEIYCISLYTDDYKKVIIQSEEELKDAIIVKDEKTLIETFLKEVKRIDPDILTGWHVIDFDLKVIKERCKHHKIPFILGRTEDKCTLRITDNYFRASTAVVPGRQVLDGIQLLKTSFIQLDDYKLETAAQKFLGEGKVMGTGDNEEGKSKIEEIEEAFEHNKQKLADYNLIDAKLVYDIIEKTGVVKLAIQRSCLTGMELERVKATIASLDSLYIKHLLDRKKVANSLNFTEKENPITGGYVRESKPGIYDNVVVVDFKSLYPSIINTFNIDPLSFIENPNTIPEKERNDKEKYIKCVNNAYFKNTEGIMPTIIKSLWEQREKARKEGNELARFAIKIIMNSFFGALASPNSRFFSMDMANAITKSGQDLIKKCAELMAEDGFDVIYGDTDSLFIDIKTKDPKVAEEQGKKIVKKINKFMNEHIKEQYHRKSYLELEFEKCYIKFLMPKGRHSEKGSKKRYAGLLIKDGKEKMDFTGLEFVRRDWTKLAKTFQLEVLNRIFHNKEVVDYVKQTVKDLKAGKLDKELIYKKALRKNVEEYTKTTPPHVKAARLLPIIQSNIIEYLITINGPEPIQKLKSQIDYQHYIDKQIKPIADSILCFYNTDFDTLINKEGQKSLFEF